MSNYQHGLRHHPSYPAWKDMMRRCYGTYRPEFRTYRKNNIKVCERWHSVKNFIEDMGIAPPNTSLERINNKLNYSKDNCKWATRIEQANNTTRAFYVTFDGITKTPWQWARLLVYPQHYKAFVNRLYKDYPFEVAALMNPDFVRANGNMSRRYFIRFLREQRISFNKQREEIKEMIGVM